jgi:hypothetical protein
MAKNKIVEASLKSASPTAVLAGAPRPRVSMWRPRVDVAYEEARGRIEQELLPAFNSRQEKRLSRLFAAGDTAKEAAQKAERTERLGSSVHRIYLRASEEAARELSEVRAAVKQEEQADLREVRQQIDQAARRAAKESTRRSEKPLRERGSLMHIPSSFPLELCPVVDRPVGIIDGQTLPGYKLADTEDFAPLVLFIKTTHSEDARVFGWYVLYSTVWKSLVSKCMRFAKVESLATAMASDALSLAYRSIRTYEVQGHSKEFFNFIQWAYQGAVWAALRAQERASLVASETSLLRADSDEDEEDSGIIDRTAVETGQYGENAEAKMISNIVPENIFSILRGLRNELDKGKRKVDIFEKIVFRGVPQMDVAAIMGVSEATVTRDKQQILDILISRVPSLDIAEIESALTEIRQARKSPGRAKRGKRAKRGSQLREQNPNGLSKLPRKLRLFLSELSAAKPV